MSASLRGSPTDTFGPHHAFDVSAPQSAPTPLAVLTNLLDHTLSPSHYMVKKAVFINQERPFTPHLPSVTALEIQDIQFAPYLALLSKHRALPLLSRSIAVAAHQQWLASTDAGEIIIRMDRHQYAQFALGRPDKPSTSKGARNRSDLLTVRVALTEFAAKRNPLLDRGCLSERVCPAALAESEPHIGAILMSDDPYVLSRLKKELSGDSQDIRVEEKGLTAASRVWRVGSANLDLRYASGVDPFDSERYQTPTLDLEAVKEDNRADEILEFAGCVACGLSYDPMDAPRDPTIDAYYVTVCQGEYVPRTVIDEWGSSVTGTWAYMHLAQADEIQLLGGSKGVSFVLWSEMNKWYGRVITYR